MTSLVLHMVAVLALAMVTEDSPPLIGPSDPIEWHTTKTEEIPLVSTYQGDGCRILDGWSKIVTPATVPLAPSAPLKSIHREDWPCTFLPVRPSLSTTWISRIDWAAR